MSGLDDLIGKATEGGGGLGDLLGGLAGGASGGGGLDDILGKLTGAAGAEGSGPGGLGGLLTALVPMVGGMLAGGGLKKVLAGLDANGLDAQAASWIGTGANQPISPTDVENVLGHEQIARIADELGVSEADASAAVADVLPAVVDGVSPGGALPPEDELDAALRRLRDGTR